MKHLLGVVGAILLLVLLYGVVVEPRLLVDDVKFEAQIPHLPEAWDGQKVALV